MKELTAFMTPGQHLLLAFTCTAAALAALYNGAIQYLEERDRTQEMDGMKAATCPAAQKTRRDTNNNAAHPAGDATQSDIPKADTESEQPLLAVVPKQDALSMQARIAWCTSLHQLPRMTTCSKHPQVGLSCCWAESFCTMLPAAAAAVLTASQKSPLVSKHTSAHTTPADPPNGSSWELMAADVSGNHSNQHERGVQFTQKAQTCSPHEVHSVLAWSFSQSHRPQGSQETQQASLQQQQQQHSDHLCNHHEQRGILQGEGEQLQQDERPENSGCSDSCALQNQPPLSSSSSMSSDSSKDSIQSRSGCNSNCKDMQSITCMPCAKGSTAAGFHSMLAGRGTCSNQSTAHGNSLLLQKPSVGLVGLGAATDVAVQTAAQGPEHQIIQLVQGITQQQASNLSQGLETAEQLAHQLQQQCSSLTADLKNLKEQKSALSTRLRDLQVRHDDHVQRLMQTQQQLEQQRTDSKTSQDAAVDRLRCLLLQLQDDDKQVVVDSLSGEPELLLGFEQELSLKGQTDVVASDSNTAAEQAQLQLTEVINQFEVQLLQFIKCREATLLPYKDSASRVEQLTAELQISGKAAEAATAEKQQLIASRKELQRKLSETHRQLQVKSADLAAVTNDRIAIAAAKTQLHHQLQALHRKQAELEAAVTEAQKTAESHAERAEDLQEALTAARKALEAAQAEQHTVDQLRQQVKEAQGELSLAHCERDNALHQVAELQLQLHGAQCVCAERQQQSTELELQLKQAGIRISLLEQQLQRAADTKTDKCQQVGQLQLQLQAATEQVAGLQQHIVTLQAEIEGHAEELLAVQQQLHEARSEVQQAKQQLMVSQEQLQALTQKQLALEQREKDKAQQAAAAACKQTDLKRELAQLRQQSSQMQVQHDAALQTLSAAQVEREQAHQRALTLQQEVQEVRQQHEAAETCAIELHMKLQEATCRCQQAEQQLAAMQEAADLESQQLVEALGAAQARIAGSTQQMVEAQHDVTQLTKVVDLQQQQLALQSDNLRRLKQFILQSPLQLQLPDDLDLSSTTTSPALSPRGAISPVAGQPSPVKPPTANARQQHPQQLPRVLSHSSGSANTPHPCTCSPAPPSPQAVYVKGFGRSVSCRHKSLQGLPDGSDPAASSESGLSAQVPALPLREGSRDHMMTRSITSRVPSKIPSLISTSQQDVRSGKRSPGGKAVVSPSSPYERAIKVSAGESRNSHMHKVAAVVGKVQPGGATCNGVPGSSEDGGLAAYYWSSDGTSHQGNLDSSTPRSSSSRSGRQLPVGASSNSRAIPSFMKSRRQV